MAPRIGVANLGSAAIGLVIGLVLGGLEPRARMTALEAQAARAPKHGPGVGVEVAHILNGGALSPPPPMDEPAPTLPPPDPSELPPGTPPPEPPPDDPKFRPSDDELSQFRDALAVRSRQARAALTEDAEPDDEQQAELDAVFAEMNASLSEIARDFSVRFADGHEPTRSELMRFGADTLDVLITAEDGMSEVLAPEQLEALSEESLDPSSYIDPSIVDVLEEMPK